MTPKWLELAADLLGHPCADWREQVLFWSDLELAEFTRAIECYHTSIGVHDHDHEPPTSLVIEFLRLELRKHAADVRLVPTVPPNADTAYLRAELARHLARFEDVVAFATRIQQKPK